MKKICGLVFCFMLSHFISAQQLYKCEFVDSINVTDYDKLVNSIRKSLEDKNISPDIIDGYISTYFGNANAFLQVQQRIVDVYSDSTIVNLNYVPQANFQVAFQLPGNKLMVKKGQLFRYNPGLESYVTSKVSDSSQSFKFIGKQKEIMGYMCDEYISIDSVYKIWITVQLPNSINPGIGLKNVKGAVLGFEVKKDNGHTKSILNKIERLKQVI